MPARPTNARRLIFLFVVLRLITRAPSLERLNAHDVSVVIDVPDGHRRRGDPHEPSAGSEQVPGAAACTGGSGRSILPQDESSWRWQPRADLKVGPHDGYLTF